MGDTKRRVVAGYAIFTLLFVSGVFVFTLLRIDVLSRNHTVRVQAVADRLRSDLAEQFFKTGSFAKMEVTELFNKTLDANPDILVIVVSARDFGILKAMGRSRDYFPPAQYDNPAGPVVFNKPLGAVELPPSTSTLTLIYHNVTVDARLNVLYTVFSRDDAATLLWELLLILLGFVVLTLIVIIIVSAAANREDRIVTAAVARPRPEPVVDVREYRVRRPPPPPPRRRAEAPGPASSRTAEAFMEELPELGDESQAVEFEPAPEPRFEYEPEREPPFEPEPEPESGFEFEPEWEQEDEMKAATGLEWSEEERAARKRERYEERTGLVRGEYLQERLAMEIERAASFGEDLALLLVAVSAARSGTDPWGADFTDALRRSFPDPDLSFEYEPGTAAVIAPGMNIDAAIRTAKKLYQSLLESGVRACLGITARGRRQVAPAPFVDEASQALTQAKAGGQSPIIIFRAGA